MRTPSREWLYPVSYTSLGSPRCIHTQSVGQIIGDVLKQLDDDRFIVKASSGPRYVVGCRNKLDKAALKPGTRVSLDMTTLTIMRKLPREVGNWDGTLL